MSAALNTSQLHSHPMIISPTFHNTPYTVDWEDSMNYRPMSPPMTPERTPSPEGDTEYSFTTIHSSEADAYFREEGGRRFPAGSDHPISLPMDSAEATRLTGQHMALKILLGENFFGPLDQLLRPASPSDRRRKKVLDVYSTPGIWIQEMSLEYPTDVKFVGVDVAPSVLHYPKDNLIFEIYNFPRQGFSCEAASYDVVHARGVVAHIRDIRGLLDEVKRVLRPGGIFLFGEIELEAFGSDGRSSVEGAPGITALYNQTKRAMEAQGICVNAVHAIDQWIEAVGGFQNPVHQTHLYPVGGQWLSPSQSRLKDVGRLMMQNEQRLGMSLKPLLLHSGMTQSQVDAVVDVQQKELHQPNLKMWRKYHTVFAIRE